MSCPVCLKDISSMGYEAQMEHVNQCLDEDENTAQAANKLAEQKFAACPICFKESECHIEHLKKCAKQKSIFPKDLIYVIQRYEQETGASIKTKKKVTRPRKTGAKKAVQSVTKQSDSEQQENDAEEVIPKKKPATKSHHFSKTIRVQDGMLTTRFGLPDREDVQKKLDELLANSVILNHCEVTTPYHVPFFFRLSFLHDDHSFVARGFDRFIKKIVSKREKSPVKAVAETGFFVEAEVIDVDQREKFFDHLWLQKDKKSADLLIRTREEDEVACHSLLWCMNTGKSRLTRCGSMFRVDCTSFSRKVIDMFITFCYSGRMRIDSQDMLHEMKSFLTHFECENLLK